MPMVPPTMHMPSVMHLPCVMASVVLPRFVGRASLERAQKHEPQREGNGEQQYEEADRPQKEVKLPSMGATVAECGRSLSA
jgi:hypothetical protein